MLVDKFNVDESITLKTKPLTTQVVADAISRGGVDQASPMEPQEAGVEQTTTIDLKGFFDAAESDHGSTPQDTNDAAEKGKKVKTKDIGYGHKIKPAEEASGMIHGIRFKNEDGTYRPLTSEEKIQIMEKDFDAEFELAKTKGWDKKLTKLDTSWDQLDNRYVFALKSLAYNVGGSKAGSKWTAVLKAAKDKNVTEFAKQLRRQDNKKYTEGMDNRVVKELYYGGLIKNLSEVKDVLPLATSKNSGVPE